MRNKFIYAVKFTNVLKYMTALVELSKMTKAPDVAGNFPEPILPKSYNPLIVKSAKKVLSLTYNLFVMFLLIGIPILMLIFSEINYDDNPVNSGRTLLVDDQENWYELSNSTYYLTENTTLLYGDIVTFNYFGEIDEVIYSDTHCELDTTDEYGYVESGDCWTTYYTYYTFEFFNQTLETNSLPKFYFCHKTLCEIKFSVINTNGVPLVSIIQANEVNS